jgi:hypothetical protein
MCKADYFAQPSGVLDISHVDVVPIKEVISMVIICTRKHAKFKKFTFEKFKFRIRFWVFLGGSRSGLPSHAGRHQIAGAMAASFFQRRNCVSSLPYRSHADATR